MICRDIIEKLEQSFPKDAAEEWDNPGLLAGRTDREVSRIFTALDVTDETLAEAIGFGADLLITHHPLIFRPVSSVNDTDRTGRRLLTMIEHGMNYYAMHTNFDVCAMADLNAAQLELQDAEILSETGIRNDRPEGLGRAGSLREEMTLDAFASFVREKMNLPEISYYGDPDTVLKKAAVCGGSGRSLIPDAIRCGAQVLVTGDVDYHAAIDAVADGLCIVNAGHYGTEHCFIPYMIEYLKTNFPECACAGAAIRHPYHTV